MGKRMAQRFEEDDFNEPDYDKLSDEELDELYDFGEIRSPSIPKKLAVKKAVSSNVVLKLFPDDENDDWLDDDGDDLYEDD